MSKTTMVAVRDEPALVAATRAGDDRAFEELYARYRERIFAFILSRVRDHGRAEDIAQEVFISALRRLRASDQPIAFKPWIYEIAKNACIDEFRRGSRAREVPLESDGEESGGGPAMVSMLPTPLAAIESKQRISDLQGAFGGLSENHHQLLVMREFEGLSYDEIGERLDMTRQMVESGLFRARRKLTEEYQELASGRRCQQVQVAVESGIMSSARALGARERRRFERHLSHCQACRHVALQAGVDEALVRPRRVAAKIAALLPLPLWRRLIARLGGRGARAASGGPTRAASAPLRTAAATAEPAAGSALSLGPAVVTAAALAVAGAGGVLVHGAIDSHSAARAVSARPAAAITGAAVRARRGAGQHHGLVKSPSFRRAGVSTAPTGGRRGSSPARRPGSHGPGGSSPGGGHGASTGNLPSRLNSALQTAPAQVLSATSAVGGLTRGVVSTAQQTLNSTTNTLTSVTGAVGSTVQKVASGTGSVVSSTGSTLSKVTGGVGSTATKTLQSVTGAATGSAPSSSSSAGASPSGTSSTPSAGSVTQPVTQAAQGAGQAVGSAASGLLSK